MFGFFVFYTLKYYLYNCNTVLDSHMVLSDRTGSVSKCKEIFAIKTRAMKYKTETLVFCFKILAIAMF